VPCATFFSAAISATEYIHTEINGKASDRSVCPGLGAHEHTHIEIEGERERKACCVLTTANAGVYPVREERVRLYRERELCYHFME
jgi:hypothetical protein